MKLLSASIKKKKIFVLFFRLQRENGTLSILSSIAMPSAEWSSLTIHSAPKRNEGTLSMQCVQFAWNSMFVGFSWPPLDRTGKNKSDPQIWTPCPKKILFWAWSRSNESQFVLAVSAGAGGGSLHEHEPARLYRYNGDSATVVLPQHFLMCFEKVFLCFVT